MKKLSIITVNYNNCKGLRKTIESVVNQSFNNYEYIIIDGGSTDGSVEVIKEFENRIDYWISESDKGIYNALNKGILKSSGEYCNFMNSGDCFYNNDVLQEILPYCNEDIILGKRKEKDFTHSYGHSSETITMLDLFRQSINHQSTFIKRELFKDNLYDESLKIVSDWKFLIEVLIFKNCSFKNIDTVVTMYDTTGISSTAKKQLATERDQVLRSMLPERIYADYVRYAKSDSPLLELTPYFNKTAGFQKFIFGLVAFLIKIYIFTQKISSKK
jgi:Glycosyltransferases involved in cell wall biogenesis